jgi:hypothetical protein
LINLFILYLLFFSPQPKFAHLNSCWCPLSSILLVSAMYTFSQRIAALVGEVNTSWPMGCCNLVDEGGFLLAAELVESLQPAGSSSRSKRLHNLAHWGESFWLDRVVPRVRPACVLLGRPLEAACSADPPIFFIFFILFSTPIHRVL